GIHERLEPRGRAAVLLLQAAGVDKQALAQVAVNGGFAIRLCQPPESIEIVALDAIEVVLRLRVDRAEHGIGIGFAVYMGDAPVVADDVNARRVLLPARLLRGRCAGTD